MHTYIQLRYDSLEYIIMPDAFVYAICARLKKV